MKGAMGLELVLQTLQTAPRAGHPRGRAPVRPLRREPRRGSSGP